MDKEVLEMEETIQRKENLRKTIQNMMQKHADTVCAENEEKENELLLSKPKDTNIIIKPQDNYSYTKDDKDDKDDNSSATNNSNATNNSSSAHDEIADLARASAEIAAFRKDLAALKKQSS